MYSYGLAVRGHTKLLFLLVKELLTKTKESPQKLHRHQIALSFKLSDGHQNRNVNGRTGENEPFVNGFSVYKCWVIVEKVVW